MHVQVFKLILLFVLFPICCIATINNSAVETDTNRLKFANNLQWALDYSLRVTKGTGISASVIISDLGAWSGTSGNSEPPNLMESEMLFNVASIGKTFVAVLILQLAEEGKLSLNDSISKWLPKYKNIESNISVIQLLNHTSGIFDWVEHPLSPYRKPYNDIYFGEYTSQDSLLKKLISEPYFDSGTGFHYSTTNYNLLRLIAEKVTGNSFENEIRSRFLKPLNLDHTLILDSTNTEVLIENSIAHAWYDVDKDGLLEDITDNPISWIISKSPALILSTSEDLAQWSQYLYEGDLLNKSSLNDMLDFYRPVPTAPGGPLATGYGLGTEELRLGNLIMWGHLGWEYGYTSSMLYVPTYKTSIVAIINDNNMMLINMATIIIILLIVYHLNKISFLFISLGAITLLSIFFVLPISYVIKQFKKKSLFKEKEIHVQKRRRFKW